MKNLIFTILLIGGLLLAGVGAMFALSLTGASPDAGTSVDQTPPMQEANDSTMADGQTTRSALNPDGVVTAHIEGLRAAGSFTSQTEDTRRVRVEPSGGNESARMWTMHSAEKRRVDLDAGTRVVIYPEESRTTTEYINSSGTYVQVEADSGNLTYSHQQTRNDDAIGLPQTVEMALGSVKYTSDGERSVDGTTVRTYTGDELLTKRGLVAKNPDVTFSNVSSTITIDENGVIRSFEFSMTRESDGETAHYNATYAVTNIGTTDVTEPAWTDEAVESKEDGGTNPFENKTANNSTN